ncbi:T9SS C-terminal target domain-containing protein [candidate division KSB1 bacterium]|nr:T9SS type A sorting domain-containing protein [candidate division KSB1 bacterium]RQW06141.1 MAG: T9SS C-terminal target domain-containing protein [candidate division KSB1 bacterium]
MKRIAKKAFLILALLWLAANLAAQSSPVVAGYYTAWRVFAYPPADIPMDKVTHLLHAFVYPNAGGDVNFPTYFLDPVVDLITLAHAADVKVFVAVGGYNDSQYFSPMAADPVSRANFISSLTTFCLTHNYDGVDLDWEFPETTEDTDNLTLLVTELKSYWATHAPDLQLSIAVAPTDWNGHRIDVEAIAPHVEWIGVMTYDFYGNWSANSGHNSPLYLDPADPLQAGSVDFGIQDYYIDTRGIPSSRLLCGIPFYGREFAKASEPYQPFKGHVKEWRYDEIMDKTGFTVKWDPVAYASYLSKSDAFITYSNETAVTEVCQYAKSKNLQGVMMWELSQAVLEDGSQPLLEAIGDAMFDDPIDVSVTAFFALPQSEGIKLSWTVSSAMALAGFNLYRCREFDGDFEKINQKMIQCESNEKASRFFYTDKILLGRCWYKLEAVSLDGGQEFFGPILADPISTINNRAFFQDFELYANYPNPFNPETHISFNVAFEGQVLLEIYDVQGCPIRQLVQKNLAPGRHEVKWDATDNAGNVMPAGVYFYRISAGEFVKTHKMILMK